MDNNTLPEELVREHLGILNECLGSEAYIAGKGKAAVLSMEVTLGYMAETGPRFLFWVWNNGYLPNPNNIADTKWYDVVGKGFTHFEMYDKFLKDTTPIQKYPKDPPKRDRPHEFG